MKLLTPSKLLIIILVLVLGMGLIYIDKPNQNKELMIALIMGIDKVDDEILLTARSITPGSATERTSNEIIIESSGSDITQAMTNMSIMIGKDIGLAHCNIIVLSDEILQNDISFVTDYFVRTKKIGKNAQLISCGESARDFVIASKYVTLNLDRKIQSLISYNESQLTGFSSTIDDYYKGYYSAPSVSLLSRVYLSDDESKGLSTIIPDSILNSNADNAASEEGESKYLVNDGGCVILRDGVYQMTLSPRQTHLYKYFLPKSKKGTERVSGINNEYYTDGVLQLNVLDTRSSLDAIWEDGVPKMTHTINLSISLEEVVSGAIKDNPNNDNIIDNNICDSLSQSLTYEQDEFYQSLLVNNLDIIGIYKTFYNRYGNKWLDYISQLDDDHYMRYVSFDTIVNVNASV